VNRNSSVTIITAENLEAIYNTEAANDFKNLKHQFAVKIVSVQLSPFYIKTILQFA